MSLYIPHKSLVSITFVKDLTKRTVINIYYFLSYNFLMKLGSFKFRHMENVCGSYCLDCNIFHYSV